MLDKGLHGPECPGQSELQRKKAQENQSRTLLLSSPNCSLLHYVGEFAVTRRSDLRGEEISGLDKGRAACQPRRSWPGDRLRVGLVGI